MEIGLVIAEPTDGEPLRTQGIQMQRVATTILLQNGETRIIRAMRDAENCFTMAVTASIIPEGRD